MTDVENVKLASDRLRGDLATELASATARFSGASTHLLKFHGIYQQDDRDRRRSLTRAGEDLAYSCMVRCSIPGGVLRRDQWLAIDDVADEVADGRLRITTRQGVQFHFVHKGDLKDLVAALNRRLVTTYAACGDVVRNIMVTSAPHRGRELDRLESLARSLANRFRPRSTAYWELWLDGDCVVSAGPATDAGTAGAGSPDESEPIYGDGYLPRKFKIAIAWPGDNTVDVYSNDVGIVAAAGTDGTPGAVILAGGGLGRSHTDPTTFPHLAQPLAWAPDEAIVDVVEAIVAVFRDEGNREDRSHARLKYLVAEHGIAWLRAEVEQRLGRRLADPIPLPAWDRSRSYLGWHRQADDDRWFLGVPVPTGRLLDDGDAATRTAVRRIVERHADEIRLTPNQDLLLCNIATTDKAHVEALLAAHGVPLAHQLPLSVVSSMACPALPTCGQALGEAERVLPEVTAMIDRLLRGRDLADVAIETRMTGCPNGCARPYVAELGIVGRTKTAYDLFVGGDAAGTRLATVLIESVPLHRLEAVLGVVLDRFAADRHRDEDFGDWAHRTGVAALRRDLPAIGRRRSTPRAGTEQTARVAR